MKENIITLETRLIFGSKKETNTSSETKNNNWWRLPRRRNVSFNFHHSVYTNVCVSMISCLKYPKLLKGRRQSYCDIFFHRVNL